MKLQISNCKKAAVQDGMIGLFFEDINYAADGGLYAEMIENRSFSFVDCYGDVGDYYTKPAWGYGWNATKECGEGRMEYVTGSPISRVNPWYLRFTAQDAGQGFWNKAYDGIYLEKGKTYTVRFYARAVQYPEGDITVQVTKDGRICAQAEVSCIHAPEKTWQKWNLYEAVLEAGETIRNGRFTISLTKPGTVEFDLISMIPDDAVAGVFRKDLFDLLKGLHPGFLRFPGGCIIEGNTLENRYRWKESVGDIKDRRTNFNRWAVHLTSEENGWHTQYSHYNQTLGIGFYEYFLLCELLDAKPLPVLNIGTACQFRSTEMVDSDNPKFEEYVQDALDLIEFANGPVDSTWGALRARMGHPESFHMDFLSVGNEQWETQYLDMKHRYERFAQAIHAKYPEIRLLGTAGPFMECSITEDAWKFYREKAKENPDFSYAVDEHYYVSPQWLYDHVAMYDEYPRNVAVFAGEYAAHTEDRANSMESALAEAALLTGIEKNADVVKLASYAPLFNRIGHSQWKPDMIWFDDSDVYLTPNYYVQKLFANHRGTYTIPLQKQDVKLRKEGIYVSAAVDAHGEIILKLVNTNHREYALMLEDADGLAVRTTGQMWTLRGTGEMPEDRPEVSVVTEETAEIDGCVFIPAQSLVVIRYQ